jgi:hydroquinone glucosyltransferase
VQVGEIYPVGPLFLPSANLRSLALEDSADKCLLWLNKQPRSWVLYVAFGTMAQLTAEEIHELALGLEDSEVRFLWVLPQRKDTPSVIDLLPQGFLERVGDRGNIVTGWAPQLQILGHSATGGFLTHCGWNSSMESITSGVPMVAWSQWAEQHINCR